MHPIELDRFVKFIGTVDIDNLKKIVDELEKLMIADRERWITLSISSGGGNYVVAFTFYDYILNVLKPKLQTIIVGRADSAAPVLFAVGQRRLVTPNASMFFHHFSHQWEKDKELTAKEAKNHLDDIEKDEKRYASIFAEVTGNKITEEKVRQFLDSETTLFSKEMVELGIAHEIAS